jgi:nucleoside-diphosphate-sugar epimerase
MTLQSKKILITGPTSQVAFPVACAFAKNNEVWGIARFSDPQKRAELERAGVRCVSVDLEAGDYSALPADFDYVLNFAVARGTDFDSDIRLNAESTGLLMGHCRSAKAFLHCSSTAVYQAAGHSVLTEKSELGDNHRVMMPTYSIAKITAEAVVRYAARQFNLPSIICRLNVPYGDNGGWPYFHLLMMRDGVQIPVHVDKPSVYVPIHEEDIVRTIPGLLQAATVPARIINWCGQEHVSIEEWCNYIGELTGFKPQFNYTEATLESVITGNDELQRLVGPLQMHWKDGIRRMIATRHPELLKH